MVKENSARAPDPRGAMAKGSQIWSVGNVVETTDDQSARSLHRNFNNSAQMEETKGMDNIPKVVEAKASNNSRGHGEIMLLLAQEGRDHSGQMVTTNGMGRGRLIQ